MTDNEIIKALECCVEETSEACFKCALRLTPYLDCKTMVQKQALALINRQKAEIERLENSLAISKKETKRYVAQCQTIRSGVAKEIAERLHKYINDFREKREMVMLPYTESALLVIEKKIDNLVKKEFTEGG